MTDRNGDGFVGNFRGNVYVLGRKKRKDLSYITVEALLLLLVASVVAIMVVTLLAYSNNKIGVEALQTVIAGRQ
jgi:competence protein ComGC